MAAITITETVEAILDAWGVEVRQVFRTAANILSERGVNMMGDHGALNRTVCWVLMMRSKSFMPTADETAQAYLNFMKEDIEKSFAGHDD
jgi:hypothetical protein